MTEELELTPEQQAYDLFLILVGNGYEGKEAEELAFKRYLGEYKNQGENHDKYPIRKLFRLDELPEGFYDKSDKEKREILFFLGLDVEMFAYEHRLEWCRIPESNTSTEFLELVCGSERRDEGWTKKVIDGRNVASIEARMFYQQEELRDIRSCRGKASRKSS